VVLNRKKDGEFKCARDCGYSARIPRNIQLHAKGCTFTPAPTVDTTLNPLGNRYVDAAGLFLHRETGLIGCPTCSCLFTADRLPAHPNRCTKMWAEKENRLQILMDAGAAKSEEDDRVRSLFEKRTVKNPFVVGEKTDGHRCPGCLKIYSTAASFRNHCCSVPGPKPYKPVPVAFYQDLKLDGHAGIAIEITKTVCGVPGPINKNLATLIRTELDAILKEKAA
jgi:hypothetical protein